VSTYVVKLLLVPALVAVGVLALATLLACRGLIGLCVDRDPEEDVSL
jgi:hypothetical protein